MRTSSKQLLILCLAMLLVLACGLSTGDDLSEEEKVQTAVAQTVTAAAQSQPSPQPVQDTLAPAATNTLAGPPTNTPNPCNSAYFISETVPDDTVFNPGESFTKTWRLKNIGTCTWNANYKLVFANGDQMLGPNSQNLTQSVAPGEQVDIKVDLKAPPSTGTYKGIWNVIDDQGKTFVYNIWVKIKVAAGQPDLTITEFSINPNPPTQGANAHVRVRAHNAGTADSAGFALEWYGLSTFGAPSCTWNVNGGLVAGGSVLLECDYIFGSWYPIDKTSIAYIDKSNAITESNEGNNSASITPFGVNP